MPSTMNCTTTGFATFGAAPRCATSAGAKANEAKMTAMAESFMGLIVAPLLTPTQSRRGAENSSFLELWIAEAAICPGTHPLYQGISVIRYGVTIAIWLAWTQPNLTALRT